MPKGAKSVVLKECGPRFEMKLYQVCAGGVTNPLLHNPGRSPTCYSRTSWPGCSQPCLRRRRRRRLAGWAVLACPACLQQACGATTHVALMLVGPPARCLPALLPMLALSDQAGHPGPAARRERVCAAQLHQQCQAQQAGGGGRGAAMMRHLDHTAFAASPFTYSRLPAPVLLTSALYTHQPRCRCS